MHSVGQLTTDMTVHKWIYIVGRALSARKTTIAANDIWNHRESSAWGSWEMSWRRTMKALQLNYSERWWEDLVTNFLFQRYKATYKEWVVVTTRYGRMISGKQANVSGICHDVSWQKRWLTYDIVNGVTLVQCGDTAKQWYRSSENWMRKGIEASCQAYSLRYLSMFGQVSQRRELPILHFWSDHGHSSECEGFPLPIIDNVFQGHQYWFMQDKDPKHESCMSKDFCEETSINWWRA